MSPYLLGIDSGNTSTKAVVVDEEGYERGVGSVNNKQMNPHPRWVEQDMNVVWESSVTAIREAILAAKIEGGEISAIGMSGHGDGIYLVDKDGEPVRAGIQSMDSRAHQLLARWNESGVGDRTLQFNGQRPFAALPPVLLAWFKENQPEVLERTRWAVYVKDWVRYKLTGEFATDPSEASSGFTDVRTQDYGDAAFSIYGLEEVREMLPPIVACTETVGWVTEEAARLTGLKAGTPVVAGAHDVDCSSVGVGCMRPGDLTMIAGTWSINEVVNDEPTFTEGAACRNFVEPGLYLNMSMIAAVFRGPDELDAGEIETPRISSDEVLVKAQAPDKEEKMATESPGGQGQTVDPEEPTAVVEGPSDDEFPSFDLTGKKALVTGATKGMGRHAAVALAHAGADVFVTGRDEGELAECVEEVRSQGRRAESMVANLVDVEEVVRVGETAVETMRGVDILLNNAGVALLEPVLEVTVEKWDTQINVNLKAPFFLAQVVAWHMVGSGKGGKIVNIASTAGLIGVPEHAAYCASKGGLLTLTKTLAFELGPHNIQVNAICPAIVMTPMGRQVWDHPGVREPALEKIPVGRFGKEVDISAAVIYLASSASDWMTGSQITVDGGLTAVR